MRFTTTTMRSASVNVIYQFIGKVFSNRNECFTESDARKSMDEKGYIHRNCVVTLHSTLKPTNCCTSRIQTEFDGLNNDFFLTTPAAIYKIRNTLVHVHQSNGYRVRSDLYQQIASPRSFIVIDYFIEGTPQQASFDVSAIQLLQQNGIRLISTDIGVCVLNANSITGVAAISLTSTSEGRPGNWSYRLHGLCNRV